MREGSVSPFLPQASVLESMGDALIVKRCPWNATPCTGLGVAMMPVLPLRKLETPRLELALYVSTM